MNPNMPLARRMRDVASAYRQAHPLSPAAWSSGTYPLSTNVGGRPDVKTLVWFPSMGCTYSLSGGCTFCDFGTNTSFSTVDAAVENFRALLNTLDRGSRRLHIAPGGSFYSDSEAPPALREAVLRSLDIFPFLHALGIETRPSYVTAEKLLHTLDAMPATVRHLTIGFGFEARSDLVRDVCVNKGYGPEHVAAAIDVIQSVNDMQSHVQVEFEVYVMLKPMLLTEREAIDEAVKTIEWAYAKGAETAVLFTNTVKDATVQGWLSKSGNVPEEMRFHPPYLRSAIQTLLELRPIDRQRSAVLGIQSGIMAAEGPRSCDLCRPFLLGALMAHNFVRESGILQHASRSRCACYQSWIDALELTSAPLVDRIEAVLDELEAAPWYSAKSSRVALGRKRGR